MNLQIAQVAFGAPLATDEWIHRGFYPRIHDQQLDPAQALGDYVATYVERDVRQLSQIRDLSVFRRFVALCAGRTGQLLNYQSLGNDVGISHSTAREWISLLEASYIVFTVPPYFANVGKRLVKSPKLYFHDVGLCSWLLGIEHSRQVATHPLRGALFENLVMSEAKKQRTHRGLHSRLHFYRDSSGLEVDGLDAGGDGLAAFEIKAAATLHERMFASLHKLPSILSEPIRLRALVYDGDETGTRNGVEVTNAHGLAPMLATTA